MCYEAYPPDIKRISVSVLRKMAKSKAKVQISRSNLYIFKIELQTSVIPLFHLILTEKIIFGIILMIEVHLQGQKVIFKVKLLKMSFLTNIIRNKYNNLFWCDFDYIIYL